jgi:hypothetical protein
VPQDRGLVDGLVEEAARLDVPRYQARIEPSMERFTGVRGRERCEKISAALDACGVEILHPPDPGVAPFELTVREPGREALDLVCYAFTANKYEQSRRPLDEHRLQVKYGSEFDRLHRLYIDESRARITLMFGVHQTLPLFIAVDPSVHNPTWFSSSFEMKEEDLSEALKKGWHGWERERVAFGRRRAHPRMDCRTEAVHAFRPEHFLTYVLFERVATGLDPAERLLLIDRVGQMLRRREPVLDALRPPPQNARKQDLARHPLLKMLDLGEEELLDVVSGRFRLLAAVRGAVAERHLERLLLGTRGVKDIARLDKDGQPDFVFEYRGTQLRMECKNVSPRRVKHAPKVDFQKTRAAKGNPCSRYYQSSQFEILAACLHPLTERWEYMFCPTSELAPHPRCEGRLSEHVQVTGSHWLNQLHEVLDALT